MDREQRLGEYVQDRPGTYNLISRDRDEHGVWSEWEVNGYTITFEQVEYRNEEDDKLIDAKQQLMHIINQWESLDKSDLVHDMLPLLTYEHIQQLILRFK